MSRALQSMMVQPNGIGMQYTQLPRDGIRQVDGGDLEDQDGKEYRNVEDIEPPSWPVMAGGGASYIEFFLCWPSTLPVALCMGLLYYLCGLIGLVLFTTLFVIAYVLGSIAFIICGCPILVVERYFSAWSCKPWCNVEWTTGIYVKILYFAYQFVIFTHREPSLVPEDLSVDLLQPKEELKKFHADFTCISVPYGYQEEQNMTPSCIGRIINGALNAQGVFGCCGSLAEKNLFRLPFEDKFVEFDVDEDPVEYAMRHVGNMYPSPYQVWDDKQSDHALTRFAKNGLGAHRVEVATEGGQHFYVVRTNMLSPLSMRDGFAHYGGDAYFDRNWTPVKIVDAGLHPGKEITTYRGHNGWAEAKFRFRSSFSVLCTACDHLFGVHLVYANIMTTAVREKLDPEHVVRRFLMPFTFNTIAVNDNAATNLCKKKTLGERCFGFTESGLSQAFAASANMLVFGREVPKSEGGPFMDFERYVNWKKKSGVDTEFFQQGLQFWFIMKKFTKGILDWYYPSPAAMAADMQLIDWAKTYLKGISELGDTLTMKWKQFFEGTDMDIEYYHSRRDHAKVYDMIINTITFFCWTVTGGHEQVGAVEVYVQDVSFCAFKWTPGSLLGTKQTATAQALLMMVTATPMPKIWTPDGQTDWSYVFDGIQPLAPTAAPSPQQVMSSFQQDLGAFAAQVQAHNEHCASQPFPHCFPLDVFDPAVLETSISV